MHKNTQSRIRLNRHDTWRTVLTDTSPIEVPIIASNDGFYKNLHDFWKKSSKYRALIGKLVFNHNFGDSKYDTYSKEAKTAELRKIVPCHTIPYHFRIVKDDGEYRALSLIHPIGQVQLANFYGHYDQLICEFAGKSEISIRKPSRVGSIYYVHSRHSNKNLYKKTMEVDTQHIDRLVRNPAGYFAYRGVGRLHQFFKSKDHRAFERKFKFRLALDIGNCFDSIYTHSICWTMTSKSTAKRNRAANGFFNLFDRTMQQLNYGETSGICIGPEASRIFAEIILAKVDSVLESRLESRKKKIERTVHYECRRYIDNYYIFANSKDCLEKIQIELREILRNYKLYLNPKKTELLERPFYTKKSMAIDSANLIIQGIRNVTLESTDNDHSKMLVPAAIRNHHALVQKFFGEIKAACYLSGLGYEAVTAYIISAMHKSIVKSIEGYDSIPKDCRNADLKSRYRGFFMLYLDICFWLFSVHPTVSSSLRLASIVVHVARHLAAYDEDNSEIVGEFVLRLALNLVKSSQFQDMKDQGAAVPIEFLNVFLSAIELGKCELIVPDVLEVLMSDRTTYEYFQVIVGLYMMGDRKEFEGTRSELFDNARRRLISEDQFYRDSELVHLLLDLLACPFIDRASRADLVREIWPRAGFEGGAGEGIQRGEAESLVAEMEAHHWFVRWSGIDLYNLIEKKVLKTVY